nr:hypothetical protein [Ferrimicrobium sp.]
MDLTSTKSPSWTKANIATSSIDEHAIGLTIGVLANAADSDAPDSLPGM